MLTVCRKPAIGKAGTRFMQLEKNKIYLTFGKHSFGSVDINNGKTEFSYKTLNITCSVKCIIH